VTINDDQPVSTETEDTSCPQCGRPREICVCERTQPLITKRRVLILQHPREQDVELGTARLVEQSLPKKAVRKVGLSWRSLSEALGSEVKPSRWAVVFPRPRGKGAPELAPGQAELVDRNGDRLPAKAIEGIVLLDGSWSAAKTLWWRNAWLLKLARITVRTKEPSIYGTLRPEPKREYVSTLEAAAAALTSLGEDPEVEASLKRLFRTLVQRARDARPARATKSGRAARLVRRRRVRGGQARKPPTR
jgi:DTW domain-containing protein YfiP